MTLSCEWGAWPWVRLAATAALASLVGVLSSDAFVNGRHGDFLGNNDVLTWNGTHDEWVERKANCRPRDFMTNATLPKETPCSAECIEGATYMGNYAKATSSLFLFLIPLWGCAHVPERWASVVVAWTYYSALAVASFMFHGTLRDVYWNLDRSLCYMFVLPYAAMELLARVHTGKAQVLVIVGFVTVLAASGASRALTDAMQPATAFNWTIMYLVFIGATRFRGKMHHTGPRCLVAGLLLLLTTYLLLRDATFCYGPWAGHTVAGHLVCVPGSILVLVSYFTPPFAGSGPDKTMSKTDSQEPLFVSETDIGGLRVRVTKI